MSVKLECRHQYSSGFQLDVSFETGQGCTALIGPSGCGKTTVLSIVSGMLKPDSGQVMIGDNVVVDEPQRIFVKPNHRHVGCVFQDALLFPHMNVEQNLQFGPKVRQVKSRHINLDSVIEVLELRDLLQQMPHELSGGQQQRVSLGRAIASAPALLLLDEPLSSLDRPLGLRVLEYLKAALAEWEIPAIYVSHSPEEVELIADQTIIMANGRVEYPQK